MTRRPFVAGALALVLLLLVGGLLLARLRSPGADLPSRAVVNSRNYTLGDAVPVDASYARAGSGPWQRIGTVGAHHRPAYASAIEGADPTEIFVQLSARRFVEYSLVGGP